MAIIFSVIMAPVLILNNGQPMKKMSCEVSIFAFLANDCEDAVVFHAYFSIIV